MSERFYSLYGMRIFLSGDIEKGRERDYLANKLMFQTKLLNVNELDIIHNNMELDDGTTVSVLSQHGLDTARIYVPEDDRRMRYVERTETVYIPAFEVYSGAGGSGTLKGIVLCRGGGFNPVFEFISVDDYLTDLDPFKWGKSNWYSELPFESIDEFLTSKLVREREYDGAEETVYEIPPDGTQNNVWVGCQAPTTVSLSNSIENEIAYGCGYPGTSFTGIHQEQAWKYWDCVISRVGTAVDTYSFSVPTAGKLNPDYYLEDHPDYIFRDDNDTEQGEAKVEDGILAVDAGSNIYSDSIVLLTHTHFWDPWWIYMTKHDYVTEVVSGGCEASYDWLDAQAQPSEPPWYLNRFGLEGADGPYNKNHYSYTQNYSTTWDAYGTYNEDWSSAVDDQHYFFFWDRRYRKATLNRVEVFNYEGSDSSEASTVDTTKYYFNCSGTSVEVTDKMGGEVWNVSPRYYADGVFEFFLARLQVLIGSTFAGKYFYFVKENGVLTETEPFVIDNISTDALPNITDNDGNPLYAGEKFRLVREDRITKVLEEVI